MNFNEKSLTHRRKLGLSQEELAEKLGVSRQAISRWEIGETLPDAQNIIALSDIFEVSTDYLLRNEIENDVKESQTEPAPVTHNTYITNNNNRESLKNNLVQIMPLIALFFAALMIARSTVSMLVCFLSAIFMTFSRIYNQGEITFTKWSSKVKRKFKVEYLISNLFLSLVSFLALFYKFQSAAYARLFLFIVLTQIFAIFNFEMLLFKCEKSTDLKEFHLKLYRDCMWFFTPSLSLLGSYWIPVIFNIQYNKYIILAALLALLLSICAVAAIFINIKLKKLKR